jgi:hypothetical protein
MPSPGRVAGRRVAGQLDPEGGQPLLAVGTIVGSSISTTTDLNELSGGPAADTPWRVELANFLRGTIPDLAWSLLVLAAALALQLATNHLERPGAAAPSPSGDPPPASTVDVTVTDDSKWMP